MKKIILFAISALIFNACSNEPKLNKQEESEVDNQVNRDQLAMDSLENAIKSQMEELDADSTGADSL
ncbi:MAG: hypothetical protein H7296_02780 [Bacteroidia bacterium]|nr:hypothetical protein [Bacteroidia bacterium]